MVTPRRGIRAHKLPSKASLVTTLTVDDVLLGRGSPIIKFEGNIKFRQTVRLRKAEYTATGQHKVKDRIAGEVYGMIRSRGGRFLRRLDATEMNKLAISPSNKVWAIVDDEVAMEKVKQALRDRDPVASKSSEAIRNARKSESLISAPPAGVDPSLFNSQMMHQHQKQQMLVSLLQQESIRQKAGMMSQFMQMKDLMGGVTPFFAVPTPYFPYMQAPPHAAPAPATPLERLFATGNVEGNAATKPGLL